MPLTSLGKLLLVLNQRRVPPQHSYHIPDLFVNSPTVRTLPFLPKLLSTVPTTVFIAGTPTYFLYKKPDETGQKEIADIDVSGENKEKVTKNAARHQSQQVENSSGRSKLTEQIIKYGQSDDDKQPNAGQEYRKNERHLERRQGVIEVKMLPGVGYKHLHRLVDCSAECHQQAKKQRIDAVDIIKVNHL